MAYNYPVQHAAYPPHSAPHVQPAYPIQPPQPPHDPFRAYYAERLRALTFNSRPLIQDLSMQAMAQRDQHNWAAMKAVVEEIESAVLRAPPQGKLPLLYLIDSISKNVGAPYTTHLLPPIIPRLYIQTYREVDGHTKSRMEEVIALWGRTGPGGGDLYSGGVRETVEREIFGSTGYQRPPPRVVPGPTRQTVLELLNSTVLAKRREAGWNPAATQQLAVLTQIGELINTTNVSPQELAQIMEQLKAMAPVQPPPQSYPPPPTDVYRAPVASAPSYHIPANIPHETYRSTPPAAIPPPLAPMPSSAPAPAPAAASAPLVGLPANVADILRNLGASGILSAPRTPEPTPEKPKTALDAYEELILSLDLKLTMVDLNKPHQLPLSHLPQRCKQCGVRFADGEGQMQAHMDWHFRRNRKERDREGRGAHRRWLPRAEEWIKDVPEAGPSKSPTKPDPAKPTNKLTAEKLAALRKKWVRVPSDPVKAANPCPVCKEPFKSEWSEEHEEWIYRNAVDVNGTIYHATCRAEQLASAFAAKLIKDEHRRSQSRSPRITPQPEALATQVLKANATNEAIKRKDMGGVDDDEETAVKRVKVEEAKVDEGVEKPDTATEPREETVTEVDKEAVTTGTAPGGDEETTNSADAEAVESVMV